MELATRYERSSQVAQGAEAVLVFLASALRQFDEVTQTPPNEQCIFSGNLAHPIQFRRLLFSLYETVQSRFHLPDLWRHIDPVITTSGDSLRLECFSSCASVYARVDLSPNAFDNAHLFRTGTTNIELGQSFMHGLAALRRNRPTSLEVGSDTVHLHTGVASAVEHKVKLPRRWVQGFLQVQAVSRRSTLAYELGASEARALVAALPAGQRPWSYLVLGRRPRVLSSKPATKDYLKLHDPRRLKLLETVAPDIQSMRIYTVEGTNTSVWVAGLGHSKIEVALSSRAQHGFSGDGDALLSRHFDDGDDDLLSAGLEFARVRNVFSAREFESGCGIDGATAASLLDQLSISGILGYDRDSEALFHRVLPFVSEARPRRFDGAKALADEGKVEVTAKGAGHGRRTAIGWIEGRTATYRGEIEVSQEGQLVGGSCTCAWGRKNGLTRGPCKHLLALRFAAEL